MKRSNIISLDYVRRHKRVHDFYCEEGYLVSLGVICEYCALKKRISKEDEEEEEEALIGEG